MSTSLRSVRQAGFSLIEVLVALAISVMVAGIGLPAVSDSLARQAEVRIRMQALDLARSKIEEFTAMSERNNMPRSGVSNDLHWRVFVTDDSASGRSGLAASLSLQRVVVEVSRDRTAVPLISRTALRLRRKPSS